MYQKLKSFQEEYKHCDVSRSNVKDSSFADWVGTQRKLYKAKQLSSDKIKLLESIGFNWDLLEHRWQEKYKELLSFKNKHKHCDVPKGYSQNLSLGVWVDYQRKSYKKGRLPLDKIRLLKSIGFKWNIQKPVDA